MSIYDNFIIQKGATWESAIYWKDPNGNPINLSGYTARFQVSSEYGGTVALELTSASGITITPSEGKIYINASATQTASLLVGTYYYELELVIGSNVYRILEGQIKVSNQVKPS